MTFDSVKEWVKVKKEKYLAHVRKEILDQVEEYQKSGKLFDKVDLPERLNSYEWNLYLPLLSDEYLIKTVKYYMSQEANEFQETNEYTLDGSYSSTLKHKLIHFLLQRLKKDD